MRAQFSSEAPDNVSADLSAQDFEQYQAYRAISALAVTSLGLGLLAALTFAHPIFGAIAVLGVMLGLAAMRQIRLRQHELTGLPLAAGGVILSLAMSAGGWSWHLYDYLTEVPPGAQRIHYDLLQPAADEPVPPEAVALEGKKVFIKGYMYPSKNSVVKEFVLCRDNKECCFGGQPKPTDMILVRMKDPPTAEYSTWMRRVAGTFRVLATQRDAEQGVRHQIVYQLEADHLR
jgi:hypothetical protein